MEAETNRKTVRSGRRAAGVSLAGTWHVMLALMSVLMLAALSSASVHAGERSRIPKRLAADCAREDAQACALLGVLREHERRWSGAFRAYSRACELGSAEGCADLGRLYMTGRGVHRDPMRAVRLFEDACLQRSPLGCGLLGASRLLGLGGPVDRRQGMVALRRAWRLGDAGKRGAVGRGDGGQRVPAGRPGISGARSGSLGATGGTRSPAAAEPAGQAVRKAREACRRGKAAACLEAGILLERQGRPDRFRSREIAELYRRGCALGEMRGCVLLGQMLIDGRGVPKDPTQGRALLERACEKGRIEACHLLRKAR